MTGKKNDPSIDNQDELERHIPNFRFHRLGKIKKLSIEWDQTSLCLYLHGIYEEWEVSFLFMNVSILKLPPLRHELSFGSLYFEMIGDGFIQGEKYELLDELGNEFLLRCSKVYFLDSSAKKSS